MAYSSPKRIFVLKDIALCLLLSVPCLLFSCKERKPKEILSQEEMVRVLAEIYVVEAKVTRLGLRSDSARKVFDHIEERVFDKTGVPASVFKKSFDYYMDRPREMEKIYSALVDSLNLREQRTPYRTDEQ